MTNIGIVKLVQSAKGTISLILIACATTAMMLGKIDGLSYSACITSVVAIFNFVHAANDRAAMRMEK